MSAPRIPTTKPCWANAVTHVSTDLMRHLAQTMSNALLSMDADQVVGVEWGERFDARTTYSNC
jgi:putative transposase